MRSLWKDFCTCLAFLTRINTPSAWQHEERPLGASAWAFPLAGLVCGGLAGAVFMAGLALSLPPLLTSLLAVGALMLLTGALHEDGLADCADGFYGARERERKLEIMRDSRIGTYGVLALGMMTALRVATIMSFPTAVAAAGAFIAAAVLSRAAMALAMRAMPAARADGLGAAAGKPSLRTVLAAFLLAVVFAVMTLGIHAWAAVAAMLLAVALVWGEAARQIGGYTGDVLGAVQQVADFFILLAVLLAITA